MNWIERMYEIKGKDLYSQNGEGLLLEYIFDNMTLKDNSIPRFVDIGGGDGFYLSNTRHLGNLGWEGIVLDKEAGVFITRENVLEYIENPFDLLSIDIDGNDYWVIQEILTKYKPAVIIAEYNASYVDGRIMKYNANHVWASDSYYGFTLKAGFKLAQEIGYKVVYYNDMNMIFVRGDLVDEGIEIRDQAANDFFTMSERTDWIYVD